MADIMLRRVRLAFPNLWTPKSVNGGQARFGASLIIPNDHPQLADLRKLIVAEVQAKWPNEPKLFEAMKAQDNLCLHDGDLKAKYDGYEGNYYLSANSKVRPTVFDQSRNEVSESSGIVYAGCYVNASVSIYAHQYPQSPKRVNATLRGLQKVADGDAFASGSPARADDFEDVPLDAETADKTPQSDAADIW